MSALQTGVPIPAHVPPSLVGDYPLVLGAVSYDNPFNEIVPRIHEGPPVIYSPTGYIGHMGAWIFRRAKDLQTIYMDNEHFSAKDFAPFAKLLGETWNLVPAEMDPPGHSLYRGMVNPLFAPKRMAAMEGRVRQFARDYLAKVKVNKECEFMNEFALRFPIAVFLDLVGLPIEKVELFLTWEHGLLHEHDLAKVTQATASVRDYLRGVIAERRQNPGDDLISYGATTKIDGRLLTDDELFGFCFNLFVGGLDTVSTNMAWQFRHLAEHPDDQQRLRDNPSLIPAAMEELLRAYAAVTTARTCIKPVQVAGVQIMPGDKVLMATTLANRDPEAFDKPNEIRLDRNPRHLTFGTGIHRCVGAPLARREMVIAMEEFLQNIPPFRLKPGAKIETHLGGVMQPTTLPFVWG